MTTLYVLSGYAPDLSEQCLCTFAEVYTDAEEARNMMTKIKEETEMLLEDCYDECSLEYYSVDHHNVRHNPYTLGSFVAKATISHDNKKHLEMWRDWSTLSLEGSTGLLIRPSDVNLDIDRPSDFTVAAISISIKVIK